MGKNSKKMKYKPIPSNMLYNHSERNEKDNVQNTPNSNVKITSLNQQIEDITENPQNEKKELNKSVNKEFGEISSSHEDLQNQNQVKDNTEVKISKQTMRKEDNKKKYSLDQQSKNSNKESQKKAQDNTLEGEPSFINKQRLETAKSQSNNQNAYVKQNYGDHKRNRSKKQNEMCEIDGEECIFDEIDEDLFSLSNKFALAHCVAEDLKMGAGIAIEFKHRFKGVGKLVDQKLKVGDVGMVQHHNQIAFYLITKRISSGKPTMHSLEKALNSLLAKLKEMKLTKLGIPTIGCGLDGLDWSEVSSMIRRIFVGSGIEITACIPSKLLDRKASRPLTVYITQTNLWEMQTETDIIIFINMEQVHRNNWTDDIVEKVNARYPFKEKLLTDVKNKEIKTGSIKHYTVNNENIICAFIDSHEYYSSIESAFVQIYRLSIQLNGYLAIESGSLQPANNFKHIGWIVLILRTVMNTYNQCELWLCGGDDENVLYDEYCRNKWKSLRCSFPNDSSKQMGYRHNDNSHSNHQSSSSSWNN